MGLGSSFLIQLFERHCRLLFMKFREPEIPVQCPRARAPMSPSAREPNSPSAQEPECPRAQELESLKDHMPERQMSPRDHMSPKADESESLHETMSPESADLGVALTRVERAI
jgi:hypothetical protein